MINERDIHILIDRLYAVEMAHKGISTRLRLVEAELDKLKEIERKRL